MERLLPLTKQPSRAKKLHPQTMSTRTIRLWTKKLLPQMKMPLPRMERLLLLWTPSLWSASLTKR
jgi:hypothetical protein